MTSALVPLCEKWYKKITSFQENQRENGSTAIPYWMFDPGPTGKVWGLVEDGKVGFTLRPTSSLKEAKVLSYLAVRLAITVTLAVQMATRPLFHPEPGFWG